MKHVTRTLLILALSLVGAVFTGCAERTPELYIRANQPFDEDCAAPAGAGGNVSQFVSRGVLDLFMTNEYVMAPLVENTLVSSESIGFTTGGGGTGGLEGTEWEANIVSLTHAIVRFNAPDALGVPLLSRIEIPLSGSVEPDGGTAGITLVPITANIGNVLSQSTLLRENLDTTITLELGVTFHGKTAAGLRVDSNEFIYPVDLCFGCLVDIPTEAVDQDFPLFPNCRGGLTDDEGDPVNTTQFTNEICFVGQDVRVDCRAICPLVVDDFTGDPFGVCEPSF